MVEISFLHPPEDPQALATYLAAHISELQGVLAEIDDSALSGIIILNQAYTLAPIHKGLTLQHTDGTARIWTIPEDEDIVPGAMFGILQIGSGNLTLRGAAGVTITFFDQTTAGGLSRTAGDFVLADPCLATLQKGRTHAQYYLSGDNIT